MTILIADTDTNITAIINDFLIQAGFSCICVHDGESALKKALNHPLEAILLDILLPKQNGFEVLKTLREHSNTPVLILSARQNSLDKLLAFKLGADDFIAKPCHLYELLARLKALLNRTPQSPIQRSVLQHHDIVVDCVKRNATLAGALLELTNTEFNILEMLLKAPGQAFSKEELTEYALGRKYTAYDRSIDVHISNLRTKLGPNGEHWLKTVRGFGYLFNG